MGFVGSAGFSGCSEGNVCGKVPPHVSALACVGSVSSVPQCPMSTGDDVFCAPEESVALSCAGVGDPIGISLCEHEDRVGAAKTANRCMRLRGSMHVLCVVQTAGVIAWM